MPRYHAKVTLHLDELYAPDHGAAEEYVKRLIDRLTQASEEAINPVTWKKADYDLYHATAPELA